MFEIDAFFIFVVFYSTRQCNCNPFELNLARLALLEPSVRYGELGTFERDGEMKHVGFLPSPPQEIHTRFFYKTLNSEEILINYNHPSSVKKVRENMTIAVIVHGYHSSAKDPLIIRLRDSILNFTPLKATITVDWEHGANCINYFQSVSNAQLVGRQIALLVERLRQYRKIDPKTVHLIGFSLGAHLTGFAGRWAKKKYKFTFGRISALDAAMYLFEDYRIHVRKGDALFVDAIHTSAGSNLVNNEYGSIKPFADIDFYPNGGKRQPHCVNSTDRMCNHLAALIYFETSVRYSRTCEYLSVACKSYRHYLKKDCHLNSISRMGFHANTYNTSGKHYLQTTSKYPHKSPKAGNDLFYYPRKDDKDSIKSFISVSSQDIAETKSLNLESESDSLKALVVDENTTTNGDEHKTKKDTEPKSKNETDADEPQASEPIHGIQANKQWANAGIIIEETNDEQMNEEQSEKLENEPTFQKQTSSEQKSEPESKDYINEQQSIDQQTNEVNEQSEEQTTESPENRNDKSEL